MHLVHRNICVHVHCELIRRCIAWLAASLPKAPGLPFFQIEAGYYEIYLMHICCQFISVHTPFSRNACMIDTVGVSLVTYCTLGAIENYIKEWGIRQF